MIAPWHSPHRNRRRRPGHNYLPLIFADSLSQAFGRFVDSLVEALNAPLESLSLHPACPIVPADIREALSILSFTYRLKGCMDRPMCATSRTGCPWQHAFQRPTPERNIRNANTHPNALFDPGAHCSIAPACLL